MATCSNCTAPLVDTTARYCNSCGKPVSMATWSPNPVAQPPQQGSPNQQPGGAWQGNQPHQLVTRGFAQIFGLQPAMAILTVAVNAMIFGDAVLSVPGAIFTAALSLAQLVAVSTSAGAILGFITYKAQKKWYGDDKESALIKALIVGLLTAIPVGLPGFLVIPSGIVGFFRKKS